MSFVSRLKDPNDASVEVHDVAGMALLSAHVGLAVHTALHGGAVDLSGFGTGAAALIAAVSGAGWMRGKQRASDPALQEKSDA